MYVLGELALAPAAQALGWRVSSNTVPVGGTIVVTGPWNLKAPSFRAMLLAIPGNKASELEFKRVSTPTAIEFTVPKTITPGLYQLTIVDIAAHDVGLLRIEAVVMSQIMTTKPIAKAEPVAKAADPAKVDMSVTPQGTVVTEVTTGEAPPPSKVQVAVATGGAGVGTGANPGNTGIAGGVSIKTGMGIGTLALVGLGVWYFTRKK